MGIARIWALLFGAVLSAQPPATGVLRGVLTDNSGAVIPAAKVSLEGPGGQKSTVTQNDGRFSFPALAGGEYKVKVAFPGFGLFERDVSLPAGQTLDLPVELVVTAGKQEVTVNGEPGPALSLDPDSNADTKVVKGQDLDALPDDPDDLNDALQALAGPAAGPNGGELYVDGFSGAKLPPKASIREIRINQNPLSAEYDRMGMGRIEILTKPGTDKLHGQFNLFDSDGAFNSRNPFAANKADYSNRFFEGDITGPLGKRASFFADFEHRTIDNDALINAITLDPLTLAEVPVRSTVLTPRSGWNINPRIDVQLSKNHTLTTRYEYGTDTSDRNGIGQYSLAGRAYPSANNEHWLQLTETAVLSPQAVMDTRFGFSRSRNDLYGDNSIPAINVTEAFIDGGAQVGRAYTTSQSMQLQNNVSIGHKRHTVRAGLRLRHTNFSQAAPTNFGGTFTFFGVGNAPVLDANNQPVPGTSIAISSLEQYRRTLLFGKMNDTGAQIRALGGGASQFSIAGGDPLAAAGQTDLGVYLQDDWRVKPSFTFSYGLRYEWQTNLGDWRDFAPRLGFAWAPGKTPRDGRQKTVLRWGVGAFYDRVGLNLTIQQLRFNGIRQQQFLVTNPDFYPNIPALSELDAERQSLNTYRFDDRLRAPYNLQSVLSLERQLPAKTTVSATYINTHSIHNLRAVNINSPVPGTFIPGQPESGVRPYGNAGNLFRYQSNGVMNQNLFTLSLNSRFSSRVSLFTYYGYMRANSDVDQMGGPSDPYNYKQDYGRAAFERRHRFQMVGSWRGPLGLQFSQILNCFGAAPYNLVIGRDLNGDTLSNERPAFATDLGRPSVVVTPYGAFDTNPQPGQKLVPRNYLAGDPMINLIDRLGRTFTFGKAKAASPDSKTAGNPERRYTLNLNLMCNNPINHLNKGGWVGNLSSPLFGQSTSIYLQRETSNNRTIQFGMSLGF